MATDSGNGPFLNNYPPLQAWLKKHGARCMWQVPMEPRPRNASSDWYPRAYLEGWLVGKQIVVVQVHADRFGWELYIAPDTGKIDETLAEAELRLGLQSGAGS